MNLKVDKYLTEGCGRCPLGGTLDCKIHSWTEELKQLRRVALDCGLMEELKWSMPCYTLQQSNIAMITAFKEYSALSFFKGALLKDTKGILEKPGKNTQSVRIIKFTEVQKVVEMEFTLKTYIYEAIEVEKIALQVNFKEKSELVFPEEFQNKLDEDPALKAAFEALTPGRQRALHPDGGVKIPGSSTTGTRRPGSHENFQSQPNADLPIDTIRSLLNDAPDL